MINLKTTILSSVDKYIQEHQKPGQRIGKYNSGSIYVSDVKNAVLYPKKTILNNKNIRINLNDGNKYVFFVNNKADDTNSLINVLSKALGPKFIVGKPKKSILNVGLIAGISLMVGLFLYLSIALSLHEKMNITIPFVVVIADLVYIIAIVVLIAAIGR